jgi:D-lactate dehydrogenase (cytochrome)
VAGRSLKRATRSEADAEQTVEAIFGEGIARGFVEDGVQARSLEQANAFWRIRHTLSEVQKHGGGSIKHDIAVPVAAIPAFLAEANAAVMALVPGARCSLRPPRRWQHPLQHRNPKGPRRSTRWGR